MSYQGDNPNAPRERQQGTGQQPQEGRRGAPQRPRQWQQTAQQPQQTPTPQYQQQQQVQQSPQQPTGQAQVPGRQPARSIAPQRTAQQPAGRSAGGGMPQQQPGMAQQRMAQQPGQMQAQVQPGIQQPRFTPERVEDLIVTDVVTAKQDTPIPAIASSMAENDVGSVVIVEEDGQTPVGIITDRKIALAIESMPNISDRTAGELASGDLVTGSTDMTVFEALEQLNNAKIRRLPVVDEDGNLQGIVTLDDLLVFFGTQLSDAFEIINSQTRR